MGRVREHRVPRMRLGALVLVGYFQVACSMGQGEPTQEPLPYSPKPQHTTVINAPAKLEAVDTGETNAFGEPVRVRCDTCHAMRQENGAPDASKRLTRFHQSLAHQHGNLSCQSCHAVGQPPKLKLADGTLLHTTEAMRLCAQCHGVQYDNYAHGAHGGMNGYWDLSRGPRLKNHCVDCHLPHAPAIRPVQPKPPPRDRFLRQGADQ